MKKEIAPEMYNYNKFPGPSFARVGDKVVSEGIELTLVTNHKEAFDQTAFGQRFSQLLLKFDYIVGDWGNEQLRLKGFYGEDKSVKKELKISQLEDYLLEFCNFGCAYFVLENPQPLDLPVEKEDRPRKRRNRSRSSRKPKAENRFAVNEKTSGKKPKKTREGAAEASKKSEKRADTKRHFVIRQK